MNSRFRCDRLKVLTPRLRRLALAGALVFSAVPAQAAADELVLVIQPILSQEQTQKAFQPLADYLRRVTGKPCVIRTLPNFLAYWSTITRNNGYDLVLDAAHFTDYRVKKYGFEILSKIPDAVSYSLIVHDGNPIFEPSELIGKSIATLGPPSVGAARLNSFFPNPTRQPIIVEANSSEEAMELLLKKKVHAAILPTPLVSRQMAQGGGILVVTTTEPIPHIALSASPRVDATVRAKIRSALLNAHNTEEGRQMLKGIGFEKFDQATNSIYAGHGNILKEYWGY